MDINAKKILTINLTKKTADVGNFSDLNPYLGGVGLGLKLYELNEEKDPVIFAIGPFNGFYPFASKTAVVLGDNGVVEDMYIGGTLAARLRFTGLDAIVIKGISQERTILDIENTKMAFKSADIDLGSLGLPGKRTTMEFIGDKLVADKYFTSHEYILETKLKSKNVEAISITGTETYTPKDWQKYKETYANILNRTNRANVLPAGKPSCTGCPIGCIKSKIGEIGGNVFLHSLVACQYTEPVYSDLAVVFSGLNALGYKYKHEDLENLPYLIEETLKTIG